MPELMKWARLVADVNVKLRRGAWYRVLKINGFDAVLEVNKRPITVLRAFLEIVDRPPPRWTVVATPAGATRAKPGERYAVCPYCGHRAELKGKPRRMECPRCHGDFAVNWDEAYLTSNQ